MKLSDFADIAGLEVLRDFAFEAAGFLSNPRPGMLTFVEHARYLGKLAKAEAGGVIAAPELAGSVDFIEGLARAEHPRRAFFLLHNHLVKHTSFYWRPFPTSIDPAARVHPSAFVAENNVRIGPRTIVESGAVIAERAVIGADCRIFAGAVVGSVGFQICKTDDEVLDLEHGGGVVVEDGVHLLANAVIACAVFAEPTTIGAGSRVGNLAFVSHGVRVGKRCVIGHNSVINGNVVIGDEAWIGPGASLSHCIRIGARARVSLGSAVIGDVDDDQHVTGNVAINHRRYLRLMAR